MLIFDLHEIGNRMFAARKRSGMTQMDVAVAADMSERAYADIERGTVNMRLITFLRICQVLRVRPDEILTQEDTAAKIQRDELLERLDTCPSKERETALKLLTVFLDGI